MSEEDESVPDGLQHRLNLHLLRGLTLQSKSSSFIQEQDFVRAFVMQSFIVTKCAGTST